MNNLALHKILYHSTFSAISEGGVPHCDTTRNLGLRSRAFVDIPFAYVFIHLYIHLHMIPYKHRHAHKLYISTIFLIEQHFLICRIKAIKFYEKEKRLISCKQCGSLLWAKIKTSAKIRHLVLITIYYCYYNNDTSLSLSLSALWAHSYIGWVHLSKHKNHS